MTITQRIYWLLAVGMIAFGGVLIFLLPQMKATMLAERRAAIKGNVEMAAGYIQQFAADVAAGRLTREE